MRATRVFVQPQPVQPDLWKFTVHTGKTCTAHCGDLTLEFPAWCKLELPAGCARSDVECTVRRIGRDGELAAWNDAFVRERLLSSADACSDIWVLEPHGLTFAPHALPKLSLRLGATGSTQTFVRLESTYPLPLSSHWQAVRGGDFEPGVGTICLANFSCYAVACCEVDCFIWAQKVKAETNKACLFLGAVPYTKGDPLKASNAHNRLTFELSDADNYVRDDCFSNNNSLLLAGGITYRLHFDDERCNDVKFTWDHLNSGQGLPARGARRGWRTCFSCLKGPPSSTLSTLCTTPMFARRLNFNLATATTFADLVPVGSGGVFALSARLTRADSPLRKGFHNNLPAQLETWDLNTLDLFFSAYPPTPEYDKIRKAGKLLVKNGYTGGHLMREENLVAFLQRSPYMSDISAAQTVVKDLSSFANPDYEVWIKFQVQAQVVHNDEVDAFSVLVVHGGDKECENEMQLVQDELQPRKISTGYVVRPWHNHDGWLCRKLFGSEATSRVKLLHFALHGSPSGLRAVTSTGQETCLTPGDLRRLLNDADAHLECVILNMCHSSKIAEVLMMEPRRVENVIFWNQSTVDSKWTHCFTKHFYADLRSLVTPKVHRYRDAFNHARLQLEHNFGRTLHFQVPRMLPDIMDQPTLGVELNWRPLLESELPVDEAGHSWASKQAIMTPSFRAYASLAGYHEKEALRCLGFTVQIDGKDIGPGNGCTEDGMHDETSRLCLYEIAPPCCLTPIDTYSNLWSSQVFNQKLLSVANEKLEDLKKVIDHVAEAVYCRKFDILQYAFAERAAHAYRVACVENEALQALDDVSFHVRTAICEGLHPTAALQIGQKIIDAIRGSIMVLTTRDAIRVKATEAAEAEKMRLLCEALAARPVTDGIPFPTGSSLAAQDLWARQLWFLSIIRKRAASVSAAGPSQAPQAGTLTPQEKKEACDLMEKLRIFDERFFQATVAAHDGLGALASRLGEAACDAVVRSLLTVGNSGELSWTALDRRVPGTRPRCTDLTVEPALDDIDSGKEKLPPKKEKLPQKSAALVTLSAPPSLSVQVIGKAAHIRDGKFWTSDLPAGVTVTWAEDFTGTSEDLQKLVPQVTFYKVQGTKGHSWKVTVVIDLFKKKHQDKVEFKKGEAVDHKYVEFKSISTEDRMAAETFTTTTADGCVAKLTLSRSIKFILYKPISEVDLNNVELVDDGVAAPLHDDATRTLTFDTGTAYRCVVTAPLQREDFVTPEFAISTVERAVSRVHVCTCVLYTHVTEHVAMLQVKDEKARLLASLTAERPEGNGRSYPATCCCVLCCMLLSRRPLHSVSCCSPTWNPSAKSIK
jgi:hypothetical protein